MEKVKIEPGDRVEVIDPTSTLHGRIMTVVRAIPDGAFLSDHGGSASAFLRYHALRLLAPNAIHGSPVLVTAVLTEECIAEIVDRTAVKMVQLINPIPEPPEGLCLSKELIEEIVRATVRQLGVPAHLLGLKPPEEESHREGERKVSLLPDKDADEPPVARFDEGQWIDQGT